MEGTSSILALRGTGMNLSEHYEHFNERHKAGETNGVCFGSTLNSNNVIVISGSKSNGGSIKSSGSRKSICLSKAFDVLVKSALHVDLLPMVYRNLHP